MDENLKKNLEAIWLKFGDIEDDSLIFDKLEENEEEMLNLTDYGYYKEKSESVRRIAREISLWAHRRLEESKQKKLF